jgi:hypothetical protein
MGEARLIPPLVDCVGDIFGTRGSLLLDNSLKGSVLIEMWMNRMGCEHPPAKGNA